MQVRELVQGHPDYFSLEPHLSPDTIELIEDTHSRFWSIEHVTKAFSHLQQDVSRIEKEWDVL